MASLPTNTKLSSSTTVARYRELERNNDKENIRKFIIERFDERYFKPINDCPKDSKHGFTIIATCCIVIETLESFYEGCADTKGNSQKMFQNFFSRETPLRIFGSNDSWFYKNIRCGILHQSETRGGWRILRSGHLLDEENNSINATRFLSELENAVATYAKQLLTDDKIWQKFKSKMNAVCTNCEPQSTK